MRSRHALTTVRSASVALCAALAAAAPAAAQIAPATTPTPGSGLSLAEDLQNFEKRITAELEAKSPEAAAIFRQANEARSRQDHATAAGLYARVYEMVPSFVHALRRRCHEELELGHRGTAIGLCLDAVHRDESAENLGALAIALATSTDNLKAGPEEMREALRLAKRAAELAPKDVSIANILCQVANEIGDVTELQACVENLERRFPGDAVTEFYELVLAVHRGRLSEARRHLEKAHDAGLVGDAEYQTLLDVLRRERWAPSQIARQAAPVVGAWLALLVLLCAAGAILSRLALRAAARVPDASSETIDGMSASLRALYKGVLWATCGYYYLSLPILVLLVLGLAGGAIYGFLYIGRIPIRLFAVLILLTGYTLYAIVRSLLVRAVDQDPGERLDLDSHPRVRALLDDVAARVGTRTVDNVYLTPGAEVAVMERGRSLLARARGRAERCLILGAAALDGMRLGPFKAILAHEYGHFSNRDTAGGGVALAVRRSILTMAEGIARGGVATWYNPAWLFVNGFYRVFLRISQGASRLQEVLADRWAALCYGSRAFEEGLSHVIEREVRFQAHAGASLNEVIEKKTALVNLYTYQPAVPPLADGVETNVREALAAVASPYDSHPSPEERFAWVRAMNAPGRGNTMGDDSLVWSLFPDRESVERSMTALIRRNIALAHGVQIPESPAPPA